MLKTSKPHAPSRITLSAINFAAAVAVLLLASALQLGLLDRFLLSSFS